MCVRVRRELSERERVARQAVRGQWGWEWGRVSGVPWQEPARTSGSGHKNEATGNGGRARIWLIQIPIKAVIND